MCYKLEYFYLPKVVRQGGILSPMLFIVCPFGLLCNVAIVQLSVICILSICSLYYVLLIFAFLSSISAALLDTLLDLFVWNNYNLKLPT